jgi:hypothetical protein
LGYGQDICAFFQSLQQYAIYLQVSHSSYLVIFPY